MNSDSNFQKLLEKAETFIKDVSFSLSPDECELCSDTKTERHYTIVVLMPDNISLAMAKFVEEISQIEPTLITGTRSLFHLTRTYLPSDWDIPKIKQSLKSFFADNSFDFKLKHLVFMPKGIGIVAIPTNENLFKLRRLLGTEFDFSSAFKDLEPVSWVTVARFTQKPNQELLDYLKSNFQTDLGILKVNEISVFENEDKNLNGAKKLFSIHLKG
ncbi:MAG: hypothetical protein WCO23_00895 [bacterium]